MILKKDSVVTLAHGGGGTLTQQLIEEIFVPAFKNSYLTPLNDSALLGLNSSRIAYTTDSFTVDPVFFPGGDIGYLSVCGTVNDLAVSGAETRFLSVGMIIEEGLKFSELEKIVKSIKKAADEAGVVIVTGDTKVVEKGKGDKIFINTSGIGEFTKDLTLVPSNIKPGDKIIVNGDIGYHGMAVITARESFGFSNVINSDVAPLNRIIKKVVESGARIKVMRDATRGGVATVLNEIAGSAGFTIEIEEERIPVAEIVRGACELLGFDPLYVANEGIVVLFVDSADAEDVIRIMRKEKYGEKSRVIGTVTDRSEGIVVEHTSIGSTRVLDLLTGEMLPRIC